jgi:hypothetical protein
MGIGFVSSLIGILIKELYMKKIRPYSELFNMAKGLIDNTEIKKILELPPEDTNKKKD